jgi:hypothetical protein
MDNRLNLDRRESDLLKAMLQLAEDRPDILIESAYLPEDYDGSYDVILGEMRTMRAKIVGAINED